MKLIALPTPIFYGVMAGKELAYFNKWMERAREAKAEGDTAAVIRRVDYARISRRDYRRYVREALLAVRT